MKNKLIGILNQCMYNKPIEDFKALTELINSINADSVKDIIIRFNDTNIHAAMFNNDYQLISVSFTDNNALLFCLPNNIRKTYIMENCSYNIQYNAIKDLLISDK